MTFKPMHDRVLVKPDETRKETTSGLLLPDNLVEKSNKGVVLAIGTGRIDEKGNKHPLRVSEGDRVMVANWGEDEYQFEGDECYLVKESDIVGLDPSPN